VLWRARGRWGIGGEPLILPDVAGFPLAGEQRFFLLQVHYDNPTAAAGIVDTTAVRLHTTSKPRAQDSGALWLGNIGITIGDERVASRNYTYTCPSECTSQLAGPVTVFASVRCGRCRCRVFFFFSNGSRCRHWLDFLSSAARID